MVRDLLYAARTIRRRPLLTTAAVLILALGIGGATTVFSVVNAVLLRPLPFEEPERLVRLYEVTPEGAPFAFSAPNVLDLQARANSLERIAAFRERGPMVMDDGGEPRHILVIPSTGSLQSVVGITPSLGRFFGEAELRDSARVIVLADSVWRERFRADSAALGRSVRLDGEPFTIIGVMPATFDIPRGAQAWTPLALAPGQSRDDKDLAVIGRLAPGTTMERLRGDLQSVGTALSDAHGAANRGWTIGAMSIDDWLVTAPFKKAVWILFASVGLLLLLACANVAGLLLAQGTARAGEMRIRAALGATRSRIIRQLFSEAALLAALGTFLGVLFSAWSIAALRVLAGDTLPRTDGIGIDGAVLAFASLAGVLSCLCFGVTPALHAARVDLRSEMEAGLRHTHIGGRIRSALVVIEVALALTLLVGAALLANSFVRLMHADPGFRSEGLLAFSVDVPATRYPDDRLAQFYRTLLDEVGHVPGISAAAATSTSPFRQFGFSNSVTPADRAAAAPESGLLQADWRSVTPDFFGTLGVPLLAGRPFNDRDTLDRERVVVVNETLGRQLWPGADPVGKQIYWGGTTGRTRTVIGVVGDFQDEQLGALPGPMLFVPHAQVDLRGMTIIARTSLDAGAAAVALREVIRRVEPSLPGPVVHSVDDTRAAAATEPRFNAALLGTFAIIAFVLAVTGVYATLAFTAEERKREMAIRIALGASGGDIVQHLVIHGLVLTSTGIMAGLILAAGGSRALASILYEVAPTDPWTFAAAVAALLSAGFLACYLPARHAARVDPLVLLRE